MTDTIFESLSRAAQEQLLIQEEILQGKCGQPGDVFMTTRALAEARQVSVVTAHNILTGLCSAGYLELKSKKYYLSHEEIMKDNQRKSQIIGLLVPHLNNEFFSSLTDAIIEHARLRDYSVIVMTTSFSSEEEEKALQVFQNLSVSGIINGVPTKSQDAHLYKELKVPCVFVTYALDGSKKSSVQVNSFSISQKVAQHLVDQGYRNFLYIGSKSVPLQNDVRYVSYQMGLSQNGYQLEESHTLLINHGSKAENEHIAKLLKSQPGPVGVFCFHDLIAVQLYKVCNQLGLRIPEDVGVVGFDDLSIAASMIPPLTTVRYRIASMADTALRLLFECMESSNAPYDNYYIEPTLVERKSSQGARKN